MPYRLKHKETVPEGIRRVVGEEIESAVILLSADARAQRDEAIHEARKSVKKIRGAVRLVRGELGRVYRDENSRFRAIGHKLSELRDAAALLEIFDQLTHDGGQQTVDGKVSYGKIRRGLERSKKSVEAELDARRVARQALGVFRAAKRCVPAWPLKRDGFAALAPGLKETYRRGRKALKRAQRSGEPADFHDLRKRVKDHWYHLRLLESTWTEAIQAHDQSLKELETRLGDDHNLFVLRETLGAHPENFGGGDAVRRFLELVDQKQTELRHDSLALGQRVYNEKPRVFVQNLQSLWHTWQEQPQSLKEVRRARPETTPKKPAKAAASAERGLRTG